ncbi:MAG: AIPR family protein [Candidatus Cloacimonetes bacterium]|nr:AIPR family protein [Candidatus Cloacimonadota bacterium]
MDLSKYLNNAPEDLKLLGCEPEYQMLKVYAYNAYFNADPVRCEDVNEGCTYRRDKNAGIDGVFINETLEENTIECLHSYFVGNSPFVLTDIFNVLSRISAELGDVSKNRFFGNKEAEDLLRDYLDESDNKKIIIRIITDYTCDEEEKFELNKKIENLDVSVKNLDVTAVIHFGDDVQAVIESNRAPFDWVEEGKVVIDEPNNFLKYEDHSIVCNISAKSLKALWAAEGNRGLLAMNLRYYIKATNIDTKIEDSIMFDGKDFWYLNNGIIIVCNDYKVVNNEVHLKQFSIVNGGQTSRMIGTTPFDKDFFISCKIIKNTFETPQEKNVFIAKVAEASNTQKPIKAKDIIANRIEQRNLKTMLAENKVFIEVKRGEKCFHEQYPEPWQRTKNNELAQDLYSFVYMEPGPARNSVSSMLSNEEKYSLIFKEHSYSFDFLRDVLFLEKAYKEYKNKINKDKDNDGDSAIKKGLVKNGLWYCLATIGYILKLHYNKEYRDNMYQYRNQDVKYALYSPELAFMHGFIDKSISYKDFKERAFSLFDGVFTNMIVPQFKAAREMNASIAYSNWTKSNPGFNNIRTFINCMTFDNKQEYIIDFVAKYFIDIDEETENANIDRYVDYCKANKKIKTKDGSGYELSENDEALRNELFVYRLNYSTAKHIADTRVFTDKMVDRLVVEKPVTIPELKKIVSANTAYYCGNDIIKIIVKYI